MLGLLIAQFRSKDNDAFWKTSKAKYPKPRQQSNDNKKFIWRKYDALGEKKEKKPCV